MASPVVLELDADVREVERVLDRPNDRWEHGIRRKRPLQTLSQARDDQIRIVALTVYQPVNTTLQTPVQGSEGHRCRAGRQ